VADDLSAAEKGTAVNNPVKIARLATGVAGLDDVLGGGLPEYSFNLIAGGPGCGKTTLAHQLMFTMATADQPALYITILGEPPIKMLRYQQQYTFFDAAKVPGNVRFLHLGAELLDSGLDVVLANIIKEVEATNPRFVFVDSFRAVARKAQEAGQMELQTFVQRLALHLTSWEATTFLIGEYEESEAESNPIFTIADGIFWLTQAVSRNSVVRKLQVVKLRGQGQVPGLHTVKMSDAGLRVYPRTRSSERPRRTDLDRSVRRKTGIEQLDEMLGGGIPAGYSVMIVGPSGSGKTVLSTQFIREGVANGERGVIAVFEKRPDEYLTTQTGSPTLQELVQNGSLELLHLRPLDLSVDEAMEEVARAVIDTGATRVVIDSLMGFELALAPSFREDFRESLYRMVGALVDLGVTVLMTAELTDSYTELRLSPRGISFLTDAIVLQRYLEVEGKIEKVIAVPKMRAFNHSKEIRFYTIDENGITIGARLTEYNGILTGNVQHLPRGDGGSM
jgi:circadian clock protein KaiC